MFLRGQEVGKRGNTWFSVDRGNIMDRWCQVNKWEILKVGHILPCQQVSVWYWSILSQNELWHSTYHILATHQFCLRNKKPFCDSWKSIFVAVGWCWGKPHLTLLPEQRVITHTHTHLQRSQPVSVCVVSMDIKSCLMTNTLDYPVHCYCSLKGKPCT